MAHPQSAHSKADLVSLLLFSPLGCIFKEGTPEIVFFSRRGSSFETERAESFIVSYQFFP